jgi:hypothetical protein
MEINRATLMGEPSESVTSERIKPERDIKDYKFVQGWMGTTESPWRNAGRQQAKPSAAAGRPGRLVSTYSPPFFPAAFVRYAHLSSFFISDVEREGYKSGSATELWHFRAEELIQDPHIPMLYIQSINIFFNISGVAENVHMLLYQYDRKLSKQ